MAKDNTLLILAVAGGAGAAIYFATQRQSRAQTAIMIAESEGVVGLPQPGLLESLLGTGAEALKVFLERAEQLDATIKARGPLHYSEWQSATKRGDKVYAVTGTCFRTTTGDTVKVSECVAASAPGMLEGYF